jgi:NTE family protein
MTQTSAAQAHRDPLASPAVGTAPDDLIEPCSVREPSAAEPPPSPADPPLALAFSGGGFRAALAALGVLRLLADADLLARVRTTSSVSGGSVAHGLFAHHYPELEAESFSPEALDRIVIVPAIERISGHSLSWAILRNIWRTWGRRTRTDLLAHLFDRWFFDGLPLKDLSHSCRFVFNAANLTTGVRFSLERDVVGDYVLGRVRTEQTGLHLANAVACSAAFPGAFAPFVLRSLDFPCANGRVPKLLDGGAYDNLGLEAIDDRPEVLVVALNAGGTFRTGSFGWLPLVRDLKRVNSLLYRQTIALRERDMVDRFKAWEQARRAGQTPPSWGRQGVLFSLATTFTHAEPEWAHDRPERPELRIPLALVKTSFSRFPALTCRRLVYRGWWLAGATLSTFHRSVMPTALPHWRPLPGETVDG